jgi:succinate dehydrogenase / fumarate reductase membrane anchor subunit
MSADAQADTSVPRRAAWEPPLAAGPVDETSRYLVDYVLLRVTGLVLSVLVLGHFAVTHFVTDVAQNDSTFVARRLSSGVWIAWDTLMLAAALAHGAVGVRLAVADYADERRRRMLERGVFGFAAFLFVIGSITIARAANA